MRAVEQIANKIMTLEQAKAFMQACKTIGKTVAFTNGCFDILHEGHIFSLSQAAKEADILIVGVNADGNDLYEGNLMELSVICPPFCSTNNPLNSNY